MDDSAGNPADAAAVTRVVLVDDDLFVRTALTDLLRVHGDLCVCAAYSDGRQALDNLPADRPDVMLVDVAMPAMGGIELTRLVRRQAPSVKVLGLTSLADEETVAAMLGAGAIGFLFKDTPAPAIADAIRAARSGLSVLSPPASARFGRNLNTGPPPLTTNERRILALLGKGLTNEEIARSVHLSSSSVKHHLGALAEKLGATNRVTLAVRAGELRLL